MGVIRRMRVVRPRYAVSLKAVIAECMATCLFVYIGTGTATTFSSRHADNLPFTRQGVVSSANTTDALQVLNDRLQINGSWGVTVALAFGFAIVVLAYATAHLSGGQLNPAVSLALALAGALPPMQMAANMCAQIVGAIIGSAFVAATVPSDQRLTLGSNQISNGVGYGNALAGEIVMTFVLVSVVLETAVNKKSVARAQAPLAIGFAVFCAHAVLLPIDGCSINPARSLGPAIISGTWPGTFWVFIVGPFLGALAAVPFHILFRSDWDTLPASVPTPRDPVDLRATESLPTPKDANNNDRNGNKGLAEPPAGPFAAAAGGDLEAGEGHRVAVQRVEESNVNDIVAMADTRFQDDSAPAMAAGGGLGGFDAQGRPLQPALVLT